MSRDEDFERRWNARQIDAGVLDGVVLAELVRRGARVVQDENGVKVDGLAGPATQAIIEEVLGIAPEAPKPPRKSRRRPPPDLIFLSPSKNPIYHFRCF